MIGAIAIVIVVVLAGVLTYYYVYHPSSSSGGSSPVLEAGGFTMGQLVTFVYNGTNTFVCTPSIQSLYPANATAAAAAAKTGCEVGAANQSAVPQVPEWILVPAFLGLSIFGVSALGADSTGYPTTNGTTVLTECGGGGSAAGCEDHPTYLYSPFFTQVEDHQGLSMGYGGLPLGVLPTPAHDHLINTPTTYPNVYWGTITVLVLDPNILPDRSTGQCTAVVHSNLTNPTGNCLTSLTALNQAFTTCSSSVVAYNTVLNNPIWKTLISLGVSPCAQVVVPGDITIPQVDNNLNGNLYIPFAVQPGLPSSFPG